MLHIGLLVCVARDASPQATANSPGPITQHKVGWAAQAIREELLDVWRSFRYQSRTTGPPPHIDYTYRFTFEVVPSPSLVPVQAGPVSVVHMDVSNLAEREGLFRDARSALEEARAHRLENIAMVVPRLVGNPHGVFVRPYAGAPLPGHGDARVQTQFGARGALESPMCNAIALEFGRDIGSGQRTNAHEVGHLMGLTNASFGEPQDIMSGRQSRSQSASRRFTVDDQRYIHAAVQSRLPGLHVPAYAQTSGGQRPYLFQGVPSRGTL